MSADTFPFPDHGITCFHCGEHFTKPGTARLHFGSTPAGVPGCFIKAGEELGLLMALREAEDALAAQAADAGVAAAYKRDHEKAVRAITVAREYLPEIPQGESPANVIQMLAMLLAQAREPVAQLAAEVDLGARLAKVAGSLDASGIATRAEARLVAHAAQVFQKFGLTTYVPVNYDNKTVVAPVALPESGGPVSKLVDAALNTLSAPKEAGELRGTRKALAMAFVGVLRESTQPQTEISWHCFHCKDHFTDPVLAALHFGQTERQSPACQVDPAHLRELENVLERYREDDTDLHRRIRELENLEQRNRQRAEELGYSRGTRDATLYPVDCLGLTLFACIDGQMAPKTGGGYISTTELAAAIERIRMTHSKCDDESANAAFDRTKPTGCLREVYLLGWADARSSFLIFDPAQFERWWEMHGQFCRAGGGHYEKTFAYRAWEYSLNTRARIA